MRRHLIAPVGGGSVLVRSPPRARMLPLQPMARRGAGILACPAPRLAVPMAVHNVNCRHRTNCSHREPRAAALTFICPEKRALWAIEMPGTWQLIKEMNRLL